MENPFDAFKSLMKAIDRATENLDLNRVGFVPVPGEDGEPDTVMVAFEISESVFLDKDQSIFDSKFEDLVSGITMEDREQEKKAKLETLKQELQEFLDEE